MRKSRCIETTISYKARKTCGLEPFKEVVRRRLRDSIVNRVRFEVMFDPVSLDTRLIGFTPEMSQLDDEDY